MRFRSLAIGIVALLAAMLLATTAEAGKTKTELGPVDIVKGSGSSTATYSGKVRSSKRCRKRRKVTLIHDSDPPFVIGETETDSDGKWRIIGPYPPSADDDGIIIKVSGTGSCKSAKGFFNFYDES